MPNPLKILRIITRLNVGGPSLQAIDLSEEHPGWQTRLLSGYLREGEAGLHDYMNGKSINHQSLKYLHHAPHPIRDLMLLWEIISHIRKFRPDVVHTHHAKAGMVGRLAARLCGVPCIIHTFHGNVFRGHYSPFKSKLICCVEKLLAPLAHKIVAISPSQRKDLTEIFKIVNSKRCQTIPLGFYLDRFSNCLLPQEEARQKLNLPQKKKLVGIVGRLTQVKNHQFFLEAFKNLEEKWHCVIIGDGELEGCIKKQINCLEINERVHMRATHSKIEEAYAALDVMAITSHSEGTPVTMIEAMAQGLPVVAANVGGIPDIANDGERALLYTAGQHQEFVQAVELCLSDEHATKQRVEKAQSYALKEHNFENLKKQLNSLYQGKF